MKSIFITATNTDVGKTYTTLKLIEAFAKMGYGVGVMKPVESGVKDIPSDAAKLLNMAKRYNPKLSDIEVEDICPISLKTPAAPYVANSCIPIDPNILKDAQKRLSNRCDIMLIEGAGGLFTPINLDLFMIDLIELFDATPLLIGDEKLGCISLMLSNLNALKTIYTDPIWCINKRCDDGSFERISLPFFRDYFHELLIVDQDIDEIAKRLLEYN